MKMNNRISKSAMTQLMTLGILIIIMIILSLLSPKFFTYNNLMNVIRQVSFVVIVGSSACLLMITGNMDLSVGSILALTGVTSAMLCTKGIPVFWSAVIAISVGILFGVMNGFLVTKLRVTCVIATLGSMYVARGLAYIMTGGKSINSGLPKGFENVGRNMIGSIPLVVIIATTILLIFYFIESKTVFGKYSFAVGGNKNAATLSGIKSDRIIFLLYVLVGLMAGISGVIMASRLGAGDPNVGSGFEFDVIIAMVLGGTSVSGGAGSVIGMAIGALIVQFLQNGLNLLGIGSFYQDVFKGVILVGAVVLDGQVKKRLR